MFRFRLKHIDKNFVVIRRKVFVEKAYPLNMSANDASRVCGLKNVDKKYSE